MKKTELIQKTGAAFLDKMRQQELIYKMTELKFSSKLMRFIQPCLNNRKLTLSWQSQRLTTKLSRGASRIGPRSAVLQYNHVKYARNHEKKAQFAGYILLVIGSREESTAERYGLDIE